MILNKMGVGNGKSCATYTNLLFVIQFFLRNPNVFQLNPIIPEDEDVIVYSQGQIRTFSKLDLILVNWFNECLIHQKK